jgi:hypothetical protein
MNADYVQIAVKRVAAAIEHPTMADAFLIPKQCRLAGIVSCDRF